MYPNIEVFDDQGRREIKISKRLHDRLKEITKSSGHSCDAMKGGWTCSRPKDHTGCHVASTGDRICAAWPDTAKTIQSSGHLSLPDFINVEIDGKAFNVSFDTLIFKIGENAGQRGTVCMIKQLSPVGIFAGVALQKNTESNNSEMGKRVALRRALHAMAGEELRLAELNFTPKADLHILTRLSRLCYSEFRQAIRENLEKSGKGTKI